MNATNSKQELELSIAEKKATKDGLLAQVAQIDIHLAELSEALSKPEEKPKK